MARKRHSDEDILKSLREIEAHLSSGSDVATACRTAGLPERMLPVAVVQASCNEQQFWADSGMDRTAGSGGKQSFAA